MYLVSCIILALTIMGLYFITAGILSYRRSQIDLWPSMILVCLFGGALVAIAAFLVLQLLVEIQQYQAG